MVLHHEAEIEDPSYRSGFLRAVLVTKTLAGISASGPTTFRDKSNNPDRRATSGAHGDDRDAYGKDDAPEKDASVTLNPACPDPAEGEGPCPRSISGHASTSDAWQKSGQTTSCESENDGIPMNGPKNDKTLQWKRKKVLLVDDFRNFILTMRNMLTAMGIVNIDDAASGEEAISRIMSRRYDIILCDYNLGDGKDGQQVLEEVQYRQLLHPLSIFMMVTAENSLEMIMGAAEFQPDEYLVKPFTRQVLEKKLRSLINQKESLRAIEQKVEALAYGEALALCEDQISRHPKHLAGLFKIKGDLLIKMERYDDAQAFFDQISALGKFPWALLGMARIKYRQERYDEAARIYSELLQTNDKVMVAYDELAKTWEKMGDLGKAQETLMKGLEISPKAVRRQRRLGEIAHRNQDLETAESAYKKALRQGKFSCYKSPSDYTGLAKVLTEKAAPEESLKVLRDAAGEFPSDSTAAVQIAVAKSLVYTKMDKPDKAKQALDEAITIINKDPRGMNTATGIDLARTLLSRGDEDLGREFVRRVIQSNHEDREVLDHVKEIYRDLKREEEGERLLESAVEEVVQMNNQGVRMVQEGNLETAIRYFEKTTETLPENKIINANAAYALMLYLKENGPEPDTIAKVRTYLSRVQRIDPDYADLPKLVAIYRQLTQVQLPWMKAID